ASLGLGVARLLRAVAAVALAADEDVVGMAEPPELQVVVAGARRAGHEEGQDRNRRPHWIYIPQAPTVRAISSTPGVRCEGAEPPPKAERPKAAERPKNS